MYYLQSRYYDPAVGRFINADVLLDQRSFAGMNMFQYCGNNPVNMSDPNGHYASFYGFQKPSYPSHYGGAPRPNSVSTSNLSIRITKNSLKTSASLGPLVSESSNTIGYTEIMRRGQINKSFGKSSSNTTIGVFGKASAINHTRKNGVGNKTVGVFKKDVIDIGVVSGQAGIQYKDGFGVTAGAKASVVDMRGTYCINLFGSELEFGMNANVFSYGVEIGYGQLLDGSWGAKCGASGGLFGFGFVVRFKPPQ